MGTQSYLSLSTLQARYHARDPEPCPAQTLCTSTRIFSPRRCIYFQSGCRCSAKGTSHLFSSGLILHLLFTKQPNPRKKSEKRVSSRGLSVLSDDNQRKVKGTRKGAIQSRRSRNSRATTEKTSWLSLASRPTTSDQWRQATCCITEEEEGCVLKVYLEVS
jgi:hypothetical protein